MRILAGLAAAAALFVTGASAQITPTTVIPNFNIETIQPLLQQAGFQTEVRDMGGSMVVAAQKDGKFIILRPRVCRDGAGCAGLFMLAQINTQASLRTLNNFNLQSPPTRAVQTPDGQIFLSRYLIADYGTTAGSFAVNADVFKNGIDRFFKVMNESGAAEVSFSPIDEVMTVNEITPEMHDAMLLFEGVGPEMPMTNSFGGVQINDLSR